ncbi:MAG: FAD-dependent oxidoreductase, partial [Bacillota bacterium]|nr:FAD-dependent oxidoreductase [Bacillota bacterium]
SISAERRVLGSVRVMANCFSLGEAAGMAAAFAASLESRNVHQVDVPFLRKRLLEEGANI